MNPIKELPDDPRIPAIAVIREPGWLRQTGSAPQIAGVCSQIGSPFPMGSAVRVCLPGNGRALRLRML